MDNWAQITLATNVPNEEEGFLARKLPRIHCDTFSLCEKCAMRTHSTCNKVSFYRKSCENHVVKMICDIHFEYPFHISFYGCVCVCVSAGHTHKHFYNKSTESSVIEPHLFSLELCLMIFHYWWKWISFTHIVSWAQFRTLSHRKRWEKTIALAICEHILNYNAHVREIHIYMDGNVLLYST